MPWRCCGKPDERIAMMEDMTADLAAILQECEHRGMVRPFVLVAASRNGSVLALRVPGDGRKGEILAEHYEDGVFVAPITCMVLDQTNEAVRVTIGGDTVTYH